VHFLRKSLVGKTLTVVNAPDDTIVFGKVGTTGPDFQKALTGKKVVDAGQQGKYFWLVTSILVLDMLMRFLGSSCHLLHILCFILG